MLPPAPPRWCFPITREGPAGQAGGAGTPPLPPGTLSTGRAGNRRRGASPAPTLWGPVTAAHRASGSRPVPFPACAVGGVPPPAADAQTWGARPPARLPHRLAPGGGRGEPRSGHGGPAAGGAPEAGNRAPGGRARSRPGEAEAPGGSTPHPGQGWEGGGWEGSWEGRVRAPGAEPLLGRSRQRPGDPSRAHPAELPWRWSQPSPC